MNYCIKKIKDKLKNSKSMENAVYFSIIVPVYNTEKYLSRCLDSLINQTFKDIEIIIVNDCSQGNCKEIVKEYLKNDSRIKYIEHSENKSLIQARKTGNINSIGKYIMYVDSDDEIEINACEEIFNIVQNKDYDIVSFGTKVISNDKTKFIEWALSTNRFNIDSEFLLCEVVNQRISHNMWNKVFNRRIIEKLIEYISDTPIMNAEDMLQCLIAFYFSKSYKVIQKPLYIYYADIGVSNKNTNEIDINKYDYLCRSTKIALDEFYNFLVKVKSNIAYGFLFSKLYYNQYNYLFEKIKNNEKEYLSIIEKYFDKSIISQYLHLQKYNEIEKNELEELNHKLSPYFFYIIFKDYKIIIKLFGVRIIIKIKKCFENIIVISLSNFLRRLFSIDSKKIEGKKITFLKILGLKFKFLNKSKSDIKMSVIDKIFNYSEDYKYKVWKIFGIKISIVKKYQSKKINIYEEIKKHEIISFDIFDTLLIRPYVKPTDLFLHIEKLYKIKGFHKNRIEAEKLARGKYIDCEEVTLNQIYEEIDDKYKQFKEIEIELEERILTIHKENKKIYDYALSIGKKIIIVSDMYLPKNVIEKILIKNNYTNYYKLYLSSDLMLTKASGNLYKYVIDDLNAEPSSIMHIGDHFTSDFNNAKLHGIDSVFVEKIIDTFLENNIRAKKLLNENKNNVAVSIMLGLSAFSSFNKNDNDKNKDNNYWHNFGFIYGGPAVFAYMNWLKKQIIKDNINEVLFVARDGYSLKKVFDIIKPESVKTHYIYAPRIIYYLITLDFSMIKYFHLDDAIKSVLEYYKDKDEYLQKNTPKIISAIEGYKFILSNIEIYKKLAKLEYQNYKEYIEKFNIDKNNIAVVDTCSLFKTSQKIISLFFGSENINGYYWILLKNKIYQSNQYISKSFQKGAKHKILDWNLAEFLITSPEPPIKNIDDFKPVYSVPSKYEENRIEIYKYISDGIVEFSKIAKNCFWELETFINNKEITNWLNILINNPSDCDKKYFKSMRMYEDANHKDKAVYVIQRWFIKNRGKKYYLFSFIPFLRKEEFVGGEIKYYIFSFIPIIKIKIVGNMRKYYLFTIFNILTIK